MIKQIISRLQGKLLAEEKTISVAESCTGGTLSSYLTSLPGSSAYFILGIVAYSNQAKTKLLKVPPGLISSKGTVSKEVAVGLAVNARKISGADIGISITGIAGPAGGTSKKPLGTVFIAIARKNKISCRKFKFSGGRINIRKKAALTALKLLLTA